MQLAGGCKDERDLYTALLRVFLNTKRYGDIILGGFQSP
jgi:hypothetical protein